MTGLQEYILTAWKLKTPFAARLWRAANLSRTKPGNLYWSELESLRRVLYEIWPALSGNRVKVGSSPIGESAALAQGELGL